MLIIAGHLIVSRSERDGYVASCAAVVGAARAAEGCLDFSITADPVDTSRVIDADVKRYNISSTEDP